MILLNTNKYKYKSGHILNDLCTTLVYCGNDGPRGTKNEVEKQLNIMIIICLITRNLSRFGIRSSVYASCSVRVKCNKTSQWRM